MSEPGSPPAPRGLTILYEDGELIAVDKPAGQHTAPLRSQEAGTLLGALLERCPEIAGLPGIKPVEPGLLHRLDRDTSGVVVAARTASAFQDLHAQFRAGGVRKEYLAVCVPRSSVRTGERFRLESRFAPYGPGRRRVRVVPPAGEPKKQAASPRTYQTDAEVLAVRGTLAVVRVTILRGFRHQVRAHLAHLGLPIAGDPLYGEPCPPGLPPRLYLHAAAVELTHPASGAALRIHSPLPADFQACYGGSSEVSA
jgi:23S rRNA pseudouridine1911/1915/1917 synthase